SPAGWSTSRELPRRTSAPTPERFARLRPGGRLPPGGQGWRALPAGRYVARRRRCRPGCPAPSGRRRLLGQAQVVETARPAFGRGTGGEALAGAVRQAEARETSAL